MTSDPGGPVRRGHVRLLMAATAASAFDRFVTGPVLVTLALAFSTDLAATALAASVYYVLYGLGQPFWGISSDRLGRVRTMQLALSVVVLAGVATAVAPTLPALIVARAVAGAAMGAVVPVCLVYLGDAVPFTRRQVALTDLTAATAAGITAATALGGVLAATVSWRAALVLPAVAAAVLLCLLPRLPEPARAPAARQGLRVVLRQPWGRAVLALSLVEGAVLLGLLAYLVPALESTGSSPTVAGLVVALYGVSLLLASRLVKRAVGRTSPAALIGVGAAVLVLAYLVLAVSQELVPVGLGAVLIGAGWAPMHSTMQTWATEAVPTARATMVSLFAGVLFLGSGLATAALAPLAGRDRWMLVFGGAAVVAAGFGVVAAISRARFRLARDDGAAPV